jgi:hypothetical protein
MKRFVYAPKVEAFVKLDDAERKWRTVDLTDDIISGSVTRRLNALSEATITLQNKAGKYTEGIQIRPMDRIVIRLSRVGQPFLVFSGYVDEAPYYQLYPGPVTIRCSDTLKLLQYTYFDPGLPFLTTYFAQFGWQYDPSTGILSDGPQTGGPAGQFGNFDVYAGIHKVLENVLVDIGGWDETAIEILDIPTKFLKQINSAMNSDLSEVQQDEEQFLTRLKQLFGADAAGDVSSDLTGSANPLTGNITAARAAKIALDAGFTDQQAVTAVAVAMAESSLKTDSLNHNQDNTYDMGLWQINTVHSGATPYTDPYANNPNPADAKLVPSNLQPFMMQMFDPNLNAQKAYSVSSSGTNWTPWVTYNTGAYKSYLSQASTAVGSAILGSGSILSPSTPGTTVNRTTATNQATIATKVVQVAIAESKKGIHESGGQNSGPEIKKYQDYVGIPQGPGSPWCAAFVSWVFGQAGDSNVKSASVATLDSLGSNTTDPQPGDLIHWDTQHIGIVVNRSGNSIDYVAGNEGDGVRRGSATIGSPGGSGVVPHYIRLPGIGLAASDAASSADTTDVKGVALQAAWFTLQLQGSDYLLSSILTGQRAIANDIPLLQWISSMCQSSARVFTTMPDGTFLAFFPDRFGYFGTTPYFNISDVELLDFTIQRNDQNLTTHVFANGSYFGMQEGINWADRINAPVASVESPAFPWFINLDPDDPQKPREGNFDPIAFLYKYGARPYNDDLPDVRNPVLLWMGAWMKFVELWAKQYTANATMTFMPELMPGGLIAVSNSITMFVEGVTHTFDRSAGFTTTAELSSPASLKTASAQNSGLPVSGGRFSDPDYLDARNPADFTKDLPSG